MFRSVPRSLVLTALVVAACSTGLLGQGSHAVTELDPTVAISLDVGQPFRLDFYVGREKSEEIEAGKEKFGAGISFRVRPVFKRFLDALDSDKKHLLVLSATYEYSIASEHGSKTRENKLMLDATLRYGFKHDILLSNRNRLELRRVNGDGHYRYRNRALIERPFRVGHRDLTPYVASEAFWDQRYKKWSMFKFTAGVVVPFVRHSSLEFLYERQHCVTCADPNTNIFGITLNINLKLKRK